MNEWTGSPGRPPLQKMEIKEVVSLNGSGRLTAPQSRGGGVALFVHFFFSPLETSSVASENVKNIKKCPPVRCEWAEGAPQRPRQKLTRRVASPSSSSQRDVMTFSIFASTVIRFPSFSRLQLFNCCHRVPPGGLWNRQVPPVGLEAQFSRLLTCLKGLAHSFQVVCLPVHQHGTDTLRIIFSSFFFIENQRNEATEAPPCQLKSCRQWMAPADVFIEENIKYNRRPDEKMKLLCRSIQRAVWIKRPVNGRLIQMMFASESTFWFWKGHSSR